MNQHITKKESFKQKYSLKEFYSNDVWNLSEHYLFKNATEKQQKQILRRHILDFRNLKNTHLRNEIKYFLQELLEKKLMLLSYFSDSITYFRVLIEYIDERYDLNESICEESLDIFIKDYIEYLIIKEKSLKVNSVEVLLNDMSTKRYESNSKYIRFGLKYHNFINKLNGQYRNSLTTDRWDIRDLKYAVNGFDFSRPRYIISFENISQIQIKELSKMYVNERLKTNKIATVFEDLKGINKLSEFLRLKKSHINSLRVLTRDDIEGFLGWLNTCNLSDRTRSRRISSLKTMFEQSILYGWEEGPSTTLFIISDFGKLAKKMPKIIEEQVMLKINHFTSDLPITIARMLFVIQKVGMRVNELCKLTVDCVRKDSEGDFVLEYFQSKTEVINRVPIKIDVVTVINKAIMTSKQKFGENIKYVFMQNESFPISMDTFSYHVNQLMKKHKIMDSSNQLVRIKSHQFRSTLATKYANLGMDINLIRTLLGQSSASSILYYLEIYEETVTEHMKDIIANQNEKILGIGVISSKSKVLENENLHIPLSNGSCAKPMSEGKCSSLNACYFCSMFKPDKSNLPLFEYQLNEAKNSLQMAKANGLERLKEINEELVKGLENILESIGDD